MVIFMEILKIRDNKVLCPNIKKRMGLMECKKCFFYNAVRDNHVWCSMPKLENENEYSYRYR